MPYILNRHVDNRIDTTELPGALLEIGRGATASLRLDDDAVALKHAAILEEEGNYTLTGFGSVTGTYVNGRRVQTALLADGDRIVIGPFLLVVHLAGPDQPLVLDLSPIAKPTRKIEARKVDYVTAYALKRKFLNKTLLTLVLTLGGAALLSRFLWAGRTEIFRPGTVAVAHALFTNQCSQCHEPWHGPVEQSCIGCHAGPIHHKEQAFTPPCLACHAEHRGQKMLALVVNQQCVMCHAALATKDGKPGRFEKHIVDFERGHPEFAITVRAGPGERRLRLNTEAARQSDLAKIRLNHQLHLKRGLKSPRGPVQLGCQNCHMPQPDGMRMAPISYQAHCKQCHELGFDSRFPDRVVPHAAPEIVHAYLIRVYAELQHEMVAEPERRRLPSAAASPRLSPGIVRAVQQAEVHLFNVTCRECHELARGERPLPVVQRPAMPAVWFPHARFEHKAHRMLKCTSCHEDAARSSRTADVLLPGIEICRSCHRESGKFAWFQEDRARTDCVACHSYHDKSLDRNWDGPFTAQRFVSGVQAEKAIPRPAPELKSSLERYLIALRGAFEREEQ